MSRDGDRDQRGPVTPVNGGFAPLGGVPRQPTGATPEAEVVDYVELARDDALLTALARVTGDDALVWDDEPLSPPGPPPVHHDDEPTERVAALLAALRADVGQGLPPYDAQLADHREPGRAGGVRRLLPRTAATAVAAALVFSVGGVAAAAIGAGPQSWLYPVHRALVGGDHGGDASAGAAAEVRRDLDRADGALSAGDLRTAIRALAGARLALVRVRPADGAAGLAQRLAALQARLSAALAAASAPAVTAPPGSGGADPSARPSASPTAGRGHQPTGSGHGSAGDHGTAGDHGRPDTTGKSGGHGAAGTDPGASGEHGGGHHSGSDSGGDSGDQGTPPRSGTEGAHRSASPRALASQSSGDGAERSGDGSASRGERDGGR